MSERSSVNSSTLSPRGHVVQDDATIEPGKTTPAPAPKTTPKFTGISGRSLTEIMTGTGGSETPEEQAAALPADPDAQAKIERHREKFLGRLAAERPRMGVAYETMEVTGNIVKVRVASATLRDEVLRHRTETLQLLAAVAGIHGAVELEVTVDENVKPAKPIRIEDKVRHLADLNPEFTNLRRTLDMEVE